MKYLIITLSLVLTLLVSVNETLAGPIETFEFNDEVTRIRFNELSKELRCPKCQNQNLSDSNSPIAKDLRNEIYAMLMAGKSDQEIVDFMVYRYGDFVLYKPKVNSMTYVLWFGPVALLIIGFIVLVVVVRSRAKTEQQSSQLSKEQQAKLNSILKK